MFKINAYVAFVFWGVAYHVDLYLQYAELRVIFWDMQAYSGHLAEPLS